MLAGTVPRLPIAVLLTVLVVAPTASNARSINSAGDFAANGIVTTHHTMKVKGVALTYTARAGFIRLTDRATGEVRAKIFFVSYTVKPRPGELARPLTFFTAGGPVEPETLDLSLGPRILKGIQVRGQLPSPPYEMVDNPQTWLTTTDLVLIDPVGTGYSRATRAQYAAQFYNRNGDAESIARFIQLYLQRYDSALRQPLFVGGVSYGAIRAIRIADIANGLGIPLRGLILLQAPLANQPAHAVLAPVRGELPFAYEDRYYIDNLPTFAATAFYHKKLSPDLQHHLSDTLRQAEIWAIRKYPKLLKNRHTLSSKQRYTGATQMARLTGLPPESILRHHFRFLPDTFLRALLGKQWTPFELADSRVLRGDKAANGWDEKWYTVLSSLYLHEELHFRSKTLYAPGVRATLRWHCFSLLNPCSATPHALERLRHAMRENPSLRVMITNGYYDLDSPYFATKVALSQLTPALRSRVTVTYYRTGHPLPPGEHHTAVTEFIHSALPRTGKNHQASPTPFGN